MKYILIVIFLALQFLDTHAQQQYRVVTRTQLNVRNGPGTGYSVIGRLTPRSTVSVTSTQGNWSTITYQGRTGYVASRYISPLPLLRAARNHAFFSDYGLFWPLLILGFTFIPVLIGQAGFEDKAAIWIVRLSLIGTAIVELTYFIGMDCDFWWCRPSQVGWGWAIAGLFASFATFSVQYQFLQTFSNQAPKASETFETLNIHYLNILALVASLILIFNEQPWAIFCYPVVLLGALYLRCRRWTTALLYALGICLYSVALLCSFSKFLYFAVILLVLNIAGQILGRRHIGTYIDCYGTTHEFYY